MKSPTFNLRAAPFDTISPFHTSRFGSVSRTLNPGMFFLLFGTLTAIETQKSAHVVQKKKKRKKEDVLRKDL
jgi:hypothetical protein